ncbi:MAG: subunit LigB of aromatic ring-opening dioxygenase [Chloroflexi bacterium]|nr:subunit LigB of aromatic ring-opening dioxygenase [Chloroflexota bacterium]
MAKLVLGFGSSHGPTMRTPADDWPNLDRKDQQDARFDYAGLLARAPASIMQEITPEKMQERYDACQVGMKRLSEVIAEAAPDVVLVVSNTHTALADDYQVAFGVYRGADLPVSGRRRRVLADGTPINEPRTVADIKTYSSDPELAHHLIASLVDEEFDIGYADKMRPDQMVEDAWSVMYEVFVPNPDVKMVPFLLSRYRPNQATPARCYALGQALRRAIDSWDSDKRVAIMASGGLSHQVVDEELDRSVVDALMEKNVEALVGLDRTRLNKAPGTPEILNWVTAAGALEDRDMTLIDYVPCYRGPAGTGHGVTYAYWK